MIYNTRNRRNDATECQKEKKTCFNVHFQYSQSKITGLNKTWLLKSLAMWKCESRTSLHGVQYTWQPGSVLMFCSYYFKNGYNLGQKVGAKFTKLSEIGFLMEFFTTDFLQPFRKKRQNLTFRWAAGCSPSNSSISGIFLKFPNFRRS